MALSAYRQWLQARSSKPRLEDVNARWGTEFKAWEEVVPPALEAGSKMGIDLSPRCGVGVGLVAEGQNNRDGKECGERGKLAA